MQVTLSPSVLSGTTAAIPSKSEAHRLAICAALADRPTVLELPSSSADIDATLRCLEALGAGVASAGGTVTISPAVPQQGVPLLDCGESGSTFRFLLPVAAALRGRARFVGGGRLPDRPIGDLMDSLAAHGVSFSSPRLPFETGGRLHGGVFFLPGDVSSQYITGLLLALSLAEEDSILSLTSPLQSRAYVDMTLSALRRFGIRVAAGEAEYRIPGGQTFRSPRHLRVDGDWSNAAVFLAAGAIGAAVSVSGLNPDSPQGDRAVVEILSRFGAAVSVSNGTVTVSPGALQGCAVDVSGIPDLLPVLAVVAACADGETRFTGAARLRLKESDRLAAVSQLLRGLGGDVQELPDGLIVRGTPLSGGTVDSFHDHRLVMSAALAALRCAEPVTILDAGAIEKSYPAFFRDYTALGGIVHGI